MSWPALRRAVKNRSLVLGGVTALAILLLALLAPWLTPYDPNAISPGQRLSVPSTAHLWGTDNLGRDIATRVLYGARTSLLIGWLVTVLAGVVGTAIGLLAGASRWAESVLMRLMDGLMAIPAVLLAMALIAVSTASASNVIIALTVVMVPRVARVVQAAVLTVREADFVVAARAVGGMELRVMLRHVLPSCIPPLVVQLSYIFAFAILIEASLSFLGLGTPPNVPTWGSILADSRRYLTILPWMPLLPGFAIMVTVLSLNLLGDGLRDVLDPTIRID